MRSSQAFESRKLMDEPRKNSKSGTDFSFNHFIFHAQPDTSPYMKKNKLEERQNSVSVVENAMANYKQRLINGAKEYNNNLEMHYQ